MCFHLDVSRLNVIFAITILDVPGASKGSRVGGMEAVGLTELEGWERKTPGHTHKQIGHVPKYEEDL
jgi:hypothetical protein